MNLFIYIDLNFSFRFGHYLNIFNNLHSACQDQNFNFCLINSEWNYFDTSESELFKDKKDFIQILINDQHEIYEKIVGNLDLAKINKLIIYVYKGSLTFNYQLLKLESQFKALNLDYRIYNTLFTIPHENINIVENRFNGEIESEIEEIKKQLAGSSIQLCFDVEQSIWNKYFDNILFLPPPLLKNSQQSQKTKKTSNSIRISLDVWQLSYSPEYRNEDIIVLKDYISTITSEFPNVIFNIKIADSNYQIDNKKHSFFLDNKQIKIIRFLTEPDYIEFIKNTDIYILSYSPIYYKNKSSGHFLELLKYNTFVIGTKQTFISDNIEDTKYTYEFGNTEDLIQTTRFVLKSHSFKANNNLSVKNLKLMNAWTIDNFNNKLFNHRLHSNFQEHNEKPPLIILGNGPSLKGFDFKQLKHLPSIGMNAAYRYWERINWYPTYYICLDTVVVKSHHKEIRNLVENSDTNGIQKFFVREDLFELEPDLVNHPKVITYEYLRKLNPLAFDCIHVTTGSFAARFGIYEGFTKMIMLGIDETYVNFIKESKRKENIVLEITETPKQNPNYFFEDYQQKGDQYQIANHSKVYTCHCKHCNGEIRMGEDLHVDAWKFVKDDLMNPQFISQYGNVEIINANPKSAVTFFKFLSFEEALSYYGVNQKLVSNLDNYLFDGQSKVVLKENSYFNLMKSPKSFDLRIRLKSFYNPTSFQTGENCPPIPFVIGPISISDYGTFLRLAVNHRKGENHYYDLDNDMTEIAFYIQADKNKLKLYRDEKLVFKFSTKDIKVFSKKDVIGCGFKDEFWKGKLDLTFNNTVRL